MTLSIAAKYPWGPLRKLSVFQSDLPQAIIFVTDSRWTLEYPGERYYFEDIGTKFFKLTGDSGVVYAGDVQAGEHCIGELKKKLRIRKKGSFKVSMHIAQQTLQGVYKYHKRERSTKVYPLYFLVGVCNKAGNASLMSFSYPKFEPLFFEGVYGVGLREEYKYLENELNKEISRIVKEEFDVRSRYPVMQELQMPVKSNAEHVGLLVASIMQERVVDIAKYQGIGGPVQYAILTKDGITIPTISSTKDPTGAKDVWHKITASPEEITTYKNKYRLGPDFIKSSSFGLYCISS